MLRKSLLIVALLACMLFIINAATEGGVSGLKGKALQNAVKKLRVSLNKIEALNGPDYTVYKVNRATKQLVSGYITRYRAVLIDENDLNRKCNVSIWEQPWLPKGTEVKILCNGLKKYVIKYDP